MKSRALGTLPNGKTIKILEYPRIGDTTNGAAPEGAKVESASKGGEVAGGNAPDKETK